ncbi:MAG: DoxX family protein [Bacteroidota bacterium]
MPRFHQDDLARLIVRVTCAGLLTLHGSNSVVHGIDHIKRMVTTAGLPEFISYGNYIGEFVAPIFMIVGYKARIAALIAAFNMLMSILIAHLDIVFARNEFGGWMIELNVFYMMTAIAVFFAGAGKYSLSHRGTWD